MKHMFKRLYDVLLVAHTELVEFNLGTLSIIFGLWILNPWFDTFTLPSFIAFIRFAPEWVWGTTSVVLGLYTHFALSTQEFILRRAAMFLNMVLWGAISYNFFASTPMSTGAGIYLVFSLMSLWIFVRLRFRGTQGL